MAYEKPYIECWRCKKELADSGNNLYVCPFCNASFYVVPARESKK